MKIRGVNLGNWLVLEKWIKPDLFAGTEAEDETFLCRRLPEEEKHRRLREHRETWITERDFEAIRDAGFNTIRIPVPYFLFEDIGPFVHCYEYLDRAFDWAEKLDLKLLVDLHTVPGGQNGTDNSGLCGVCTWSTKKEYRDLTLEVLERIALRYGKRDALWGIEAINEPMCSDTPSGQGMNIAMLSQIYPPADPEMAKDNTNYPLSYLQDFYRDAYRRMKPHLAGDKRIVFSDAFFPEGWGEFFAENEFENIILDTHQYLTMVEYGFGAERPFEKYEAFLSRLGELLRQVNRDVPMCVGEWSLSNMMTGLEELNAEERSDVLRRLGRAYRKAVDVCDGWFYWTWKLDTPEPGREVWDGSVCLKNGWLTVN